MDTRSGHADEAFQDGDLVLVELRTSSTFAGEQGEDAEVVPQGTQLVGVWEVEQPAEEGAFAVSINGTRLHLRPRGCEAAAGSTDDTYLERARTHRRRTPGPGEDRRAAGEGR